jgi:prepilin-type processing-associated H-X9-DG protein
MTFAANKKIGSEKSIYCHFSLIEMMIVIGVVALLMTLFLPVLAKAREKAREAGCRNNLRQIGAAIAFYPDENNGYAIPCVFEVPVGGSYKYYSWIDYLHSNSSIVDGTAKCLSMTDEECFNPYGGNDIFTNPVKVGSYTMNVIDRGAWGGAAISSDPSESAGWGFGSGKPVNLKRTGDLSDKICIADVLMRRPEYSLTDSDATRIVHYLETDHGMLPIGTGLKRRDVGNHHSGGFNALFGDAHAETMKSSLPDQWVVFVE